MKVNGKMMLDVEKEIFMGQMAISMKVIGKTMSSMVMEFIQHLKEINMKENFKMILGVGKEITYE